MTTKQGGLRGSVRNVGVGVGIPDSGDLHSAYDFSQEDGTLPITDQSGNGRSLSNGSYTGVGGDINGNQAGVFDGADDAVWRDDTALTSPFTVFSVVDLDSSPNSLNDQWSLRASDPSVDLIHRNDDNNVTLEVDATQLTGGSEFDTLVTALVDGSNTVLRTQGTQVASGSVTHPGTEGITLGSRQQGRDRFFDGDIGEVLFYDINKSESFNEIESYLADKWGITI